MSKNKKQKPVNGLVAYKEDQVPPSLRVNPFFTKILSLDAKDLFLFNVEALKGYGYTDLQIHWDAEEGYIYAKGDLPVCLCAHMDKVPHYKKVKKILAGCVKDNQGRIIDTILTCKQGIGGDDRCGVYAIHQMLKLKHRPHVLFTMGEEIGCCGSRKFTKDFPAEFLDGLSAFIQIDRRGNNDCVRYSDQSMELTNAVCQFGFKPAFGSCTDISVLMPHFGISGVNLSSGYYHEHCASAEYVSVFDVNRLLVRLEKILSSDIFCRKYVYEAPKPVRFDYIPDYNTGEVHRNAEQMSLLPDYPYDDQRYAHCDCCGEMVFAYDLVEVDDDWCDLVCPDCAQHVYLDGGEYVRCPACNNLFKPTVKKSDPKFLVDSCPFCGCVLEND